jgi:hypothetical protein
MAETGKLEEDFDVVYGAAREVIEARGTRRPGESWLAYAEGSLEVARTEAGEYEVRHQGVLVFRRPAGGSRDDAQVFEPGEWMVRLVQAGRPRA